MSSRPRRWTTDLRPLQPEFIRQTVAAHTSQSALYVELWQTNLVLDTADAYALESPVWSRFPQLASNQNIPHSSSQDLKPGELSNTNWWDLKVRRHADTRDLSTRRDIRQRLNLHHCALLSQHKSLARCETL